MKKVFIGLVVILFSGVVYFALTKNASSPNPETADSLFPLPSESKDTPASPEESQESPKEIPKKLALNVPFTPQAPTANWDELHNEACEEASVIMSVFYFQGDKRETLPPQEVEREIEKLTKWQQENLGYNLSIDAAETARMIQSVYGLQAEVVRDFSESTIKQFLADEKLVLVPANGRKLGNPYFQNPGPIYHMFVITGYHGDTFITHDPGTKRGKNYEYSYKTIRDAVGDYDHDREVTVPTDPALIIVSKLQ